MSKRELVALARSKMGNPFVSVRRNPENVWIAEVTNFSCAEGFVIHGLSRGGVVRAAARLLAVWKTEEPE